MIFQYFRDESGNLYYKGGDTKRSTYKINLDEIPYVVLSLILTKAAGPSSMLMTRIDSIMNCLLPLEVYTSPDMNISLNLVFDSNNNLPPEIHIKVIDKPLTIHYFGTSTSEAGHFMWEFNGERTRYKGLSGFKYLPFDPEGLYKYARNEEIFKGNTKFYHIDNYSIWFIEGSPIDKRWGTKSVFWVQELVPPEALKQMILDCPAARRIIDKMPFTVNWNV